MFVIQDPRRTMQTWSSGNHLLLGVIGHYAQSGPSDGEFGIHASSHALIFYPSLTLPIWLCLSALAPVIILFHVKEALLFNFAFKRSPSR